MIGKNPNHRPVVRLLDPPADTDRDPRQVRLIHRLSFLARWISFIKPSSPLSAALQTRANAIASMPDPFELSNVPLLNGNDEPFDLSPYRFDSPHSRFFSSRSVITNGPTGGHVIVVDEEWLFFCGIRAELLDLAATQNFADILSYNGVPATVEKTVRCWFPLGRFKNSNLNVDSEAVVSTGPGYVVFEASGDIHYSAGGLAFGWLSRPSDL
jgi:hypothetical protein